MWPTCKSWVRKGHSLSQAKCPEYARKTVAQGTSHRQGCDQIPKSCLDLWEVHACSQVELYTSLNEEGKEVAEVVSAFPFPSLDRMQALEKVSASLDSIERIRFLWNEGQDRKMLAVRWMPTTAWHQAPALRRILWELPLWFWREETVIIACPSARAEQDTLALTEWGTRAVAAAPRLEIRDSYSSRSIRWSRCPSRG